MNTKIPYKQIISKHYGDICRPESLHIQRSSILRVNLREMFLLFVGQATCAAPLCSLFFLSAAATARVASCIEAKWSIFKNDETLTL
jgi:hypothetical protein